MRRLRVIVAEPWLAGSHRAWADGFAATSRHEVRVLGLPPGGWRWRLRAGAFPLAEQISGVVAEEDDWPDVLIVSGLVDVSSLLGHLRLPPHVAVIAYMHETQLVYPTVDGSVDADAALRNWSSWLAADAVWFNSDFHRRAVIDALPGWAASQPEPMAETLIERVTDRFAVMPVGVARPTHRRSTQGADASARPAILWPHRWEPDKCPAVFVRAIDKLDAAGVAADLILAGEDLASSPARADLLERHAARVIAAGPFSRHDYERWLARADIVVSCADHEFFGVAVVEAMMAGCAPLLPADLSYPEIVPERYHLSVLYPKGTFGSRLLDVVERFDDHRAAVEGLAESMAAFEWAQVAPAYDRGIDELVDRRGVVSD